MFLAPNDGERRTSAVSGETLGVLGDGVVGVVGVGGAGGDFLFLRSLWWFSSAASALFFFFDLSAADAVALDDFGVKI